MTHSTVAASRFRRNLAAQDLTALGLGVYFRSLVLGGNVCAPGELLLVLRVSSS